MVNIAICDDDESFRQSLNITLTKCLPSSLSITQYADGVELLRYMEQRQGLIDLVLLDIRMPQIDGLQTARRIREIDAGIVIILITNYKEYVFDGYDVQAFHFLTKPLDETRLLPIISSAIKLIEQNRVDFLAVNMQSECAYVPLREILYIESNSRKLSIHTVNEMLVYYEKLSILADRLASKGFCLIHRCYLVNLDAVRHVDKQGLWVSLRDGRKLDVSRRRLHGLLHAMLGGL